MLSDIVADTVFGRGPSPLDSDPKGFFGTDAINATAVPVRRMPAERK